MVQTVVAHAITAAPPERVYALLKDSASWESWSSMDRVELDTPGSDEPDGVGSVRALTRGRYHGLDEVVELVPGRRFGYRHRGLPVRDYLANVDLEPADGGTAIRWQATFRPKYPGTGWFWRLGIRSLLRTMATRLAEHAARA